MILWKSRSYKILKDSGLSVLDLALSLNLEIWQVKDILDGVQAASYNQAKKLLSVFGIKSICWAMKGNWKWLRYAY